MAKIGRPIKAEHRDKTVMVRFTDREYQKLKKCAEKSNLTVAETVRKGIHTIIGSEE